MATRTVTEEDWQEPLRELLRQAKRLRERAERLQRRVRPGRSLLEGLLACENLRRELFGELFCRELEELSLVMEGGGEENRESSGGKEKMGGKGNSMD